MTSLDVVIVNWNSGNLLRECIASFADISRTGFELSMVAVVDNASRDGSADGLRCEGLPLSVVRNVTNVGFAAACNQGAALGNADYILFLNPDTKLFPSTLRDVLGFMESPAANGVAICGAQLLDARGNVARTCVRFPTIPRQIAHFFGLPYIAPNTFPRELMVEWDHSASRVVDQVMGAFFLVRRSVFQSLRGFDERFFVYYEEMDFCRRAAAQNLTTYYLSTAQLFHKGQGTTAKVPATSLFLLLRSRALYCYKHFGTRWGTLMVGLTIAVEPLSRTLVSVARRYSAANLGSILVAYARFCKALPRLDIKNGLWP